MAKEQEMMTDEKWTAWTNAIIEWGENFDSHLQTLIDAPEGQFEIDEEEMEENWLTIQNNRSLFISSDNLRLGVAFLGECPNALI